jgi:hypothetical protein
MMGIPIAVGGRTWGAIVVSATDAEPLPADTEGRLADFTELLATAIANSEAQAEVARLAEEQAALRRVATPGAQGTPSDAALQCGVRRGRGARRGGRLRRRPLRGRRPGDRHGNPRHAAPRRARAYAYGPPPVRIAEAELDQARAAGVLLELDRTRVILDRGVYRELVKAAVARTVEELRARGQERASEQRESQERRQQA